MLVPALGPAFLTSGMFAFLASMDNYPISIFFTDAWTKTLPIQMLQYVEENPDPTIAAISSGLVLLAILALDRRRPAGRPAQTRGFLGHDDEPKPCDLLVTADLIMTLDAAGRIVKNGAIAVTDRDDRRYRPGRRTARRAGRRPETIEGKGRIVMAGLVNVHNHTPLMITRGMIEDVGFAPMYTPGIPQGHWLTADDAYALSSLGHYELLRAGCTTVMDFYRYPSSCARAASELGVRAVIAGRVHDAEPGSLANGTHSYSTAIGQASLKENAELIERWNGHDNGRIRCDWAPHAPDTCSDDLLREVKKLADAHGGNVHTHLSQLPAEIEAVKARTGLTPPQLMDKLGLLNEKTDRRALHPHGPRRHRAVRQVEDDGGARADRQRQGRPHRADHGADGSRRPHRALHRHLLGRHDRGDALGDLHAAHQPPGQRARPAHRARLGTRRPAPTRSGLGDKVGSLEVGKKADIVLLDNRSPIAGADDRRLRRAGAQRLGPRRRHGDRRRPVVLAGGRLTLADGDAIVANAQAVAAQALAARGPRGDRLSCRA